MPNSSENSVAKEGDRSKLGNFFGNLIIPTKYLPFFRHEELSNDTRSVMLVAVTLVAAVTFQAGVTPPGGVWQDSSGHVAGHAIYSSQRVPYYFFLICNTLAFSSSIYLLLSLTFGYPFFLEVLVAIFSLSGTYAAAIFAVTPYESAPFRLIALVAVFPVILRPSIYVLCRMFSTGRSENETTNKV